MSPLLLAAPFWLCFEIVQLVVAERFLGIRRLAVGTDPREAGPPERTAFLWVVCIVLYWAWMAAMLYQPVGKLQILAMLVVTVGGFFLRRAATAKWVLVLLTFEGAIRLGMLLSLCVHAWRRL